MTAKVDQGAWAQEQSSDDFYAGKAGRVDCVAAAGATAGRLKQAVTVQTSPCFDFDGAEAHQATRFVLLFDFFDHSNRQEFDFVRKYVICGESFHDYLFFEPTRQI